MRLEIEAIVDTPSFLFLWCAPCYTDLRPVHAEVANYS